MYKPVQNTERKLQISSRIFVYTVSVVLAFGSFNLGFSMVCVTMLQKYIRSINRLNQEQIHYYLSFATAMLPLGAILGSYLVKRLQKLGENKIMKYTDYLTIFSSLLMISTLKMLPFLLGRFVIGISCGLTLGIVPAYLLSLSPPEISGIIGSIHQLMLAIGIAFAYYTGNLLENLSVSYLENWQVYLAIPFIYSIIRLVILQLFNFDSLEKHYEDNQTDKLKKYMKIFYTKVDIEELKRIKKFRKENQKDDSQDLFLGMPKKAAFIAFVIVALNQLSGITSILFYGKQLFLKISSFDEQKAGYQIVKLGLVQIIAAFVGGWLINQYGRRPILLIGSAVVVSCLLFGFLVNFFFPLSKNILISIVFIHIFAASLSIGPISMVYIAQILENLSVVLLSYWSLMLFISLVSQILVNLLGLGPVFLVFFLISTLCLAYLYFHMIETKEKTRQQVINQYRGGHKDDGTIKEYTTISMEENNNSLIES